MTKPMSPVEALKVALAKENSSINLYKKLLIEHPPIKDILEALLNEEEKHKKLISAKIVEMTR